LKKLNHFSEIYDLYNTFIIDLWGVMHDGNKLHNGAIEVVKNLNNKEKRVIFLSNAPRPNKDVVGFLRKLNMEESFLKNILTSGEVAMKLIKSNKFGIKFYHIGPERDSSIFIGLEKNKTSLKNCDYILCTGLFDENSKDLKCYENLLKSSLSKKLICTNPDLTVHRGENEEYCAGAIAKIFKLMGGEVIYFGKPYKEVYENILREGEKNLIIGDNLNTDIKGANNLKIDSLFITSGVHRSEFECENEIKKLLNTYQVTANYFQKKLTW
jgi:HAD superfamily hydrolase (TIGR01459 family)